MSDRNKIYRGYIASKEWRDKRKEYLWHDNIACEWCGEEKATDVHHTTYKNITKEESGDLVPLCKDCHYKIHRRAKELKIKEIPDDFLDEPIVVELSKVLPLGVSGTYYIGRAEYFNVYLEYEFKKIFTVYICSGFTIDKRAAMWFDFTKQEGDLFECAVSMPKSTKDIIDLVNKNMFGSRLVEYVNSLSVDELKKHTMRYMYEDRRIDKENT